jgi:post-segregation antitoxin (ccd killing protein)
MGLPYKTNRRETHRLIQAWVEREEVERLLAAKVNLSEVIRQAIKIACAELQIGKDENTPK